MFPTRNFHKTQHDIKVVYIIGTEEFLLSALLESILLLSKKVLIKNNKDLIFTYRRMLKKNNFNKNQVSYFMGVRPCLLRLRRMYFEDLGAAFFF